MHHTGIRISGTICRSSHKRGAVIVLLNGESKYRVFESSQVEDTSPKVVHPSHCKPYSEMKKVGAQNLNRSACGKFF